MTQQEVRQMFIKANPGVRRAGYKGYWYRCAHCHKWCGRPGGERANIPDSDKMEVDHIIPFSKAGQASNQLGNLQPLCKPCNRSKLNNQSGFDTAKAVIQTAASGGLPKLMGGMLLTSAGKKIGIKPRRS